MISPKKWEEFEIGDTLFLNSMRDGRKELIVVDKLFPNKKEGIRLGPDLMTWDARTYLATVAKAMGRHSKAYLKVATPLRYGEREEQIRYAIIDESLSSTESIIPHRILEPYTVPPYFVFQGVDRYRVAKVGSLYEWDIEELLTHNHGEVRAIAKDIMNGISWVGKH